MPVLLSLLCLAAAGPADDLLAQVDAAIRPGDDAHLVLAISATDRRGRVSQRTLEITQSGTDKRLVRFTAPPRVNGIALLVPDGDTVYLFLPSYGRPRRIVGSSRGDAFFGTDFSMEDLSRTSWAAEYRPAVTGDHLTLTPKNPDDAASARVELWMDDATHLPTRVEHFNADNTLMRRISFTDVAPEDGRAIAHTIVVEDVARSRSTRAIVQEAAFDRGVDDDIFTLSSLQP